MNVCPIIVLMALNKSFLSCAFLSRLCLKEGQWSLLLLSDYLLGMTLKERLSTWLPMHSSHVLIFAISNLLSKFWIHFIADPTIKVYPMKLKDIEKMFQLKSKWDIFGCSVFLWSISYVKDIFVGINYFPILIIFLSCAVCANIVSVWTIFCMSDFIWNMSFFSVSFHSFCYFGFLVKLLNYLLFIHTGILDFKTLCNQHNKVKYSLYVVCSD